MEALISLCVACAVENRSNSHGMGTEQTQSPHHQLREETQLLLRNSHELGKAYTFILESIKGNIHELIEGDSLSPSFHKLQDILDAGKGSTQVSVERLLFGSESSDHASTTIGVGTTGDHQAAAWRSPKDSRAIDTTVESWAFVAGRLKRPTQKLGQQLPRTRALD